ncbi:hypothetical protein [Sphingomonas japonica]|uniref:Phospholipase D-like domain-containing protein n=1 Tax=Sphingomonas japonica TaxID=511662 RepID=A0ABX0TXA9_9SPHN|nr:hypothetical protein [Sphingomonas japonica]NIJ22858.1 hypothetical protein [Sphingomonas japonica]
MKLTESRYISAAFAYSSIYGVYHLHDVVQQRNILGVSLISDIRDCITHPQALQFGLDKGWSVRVVNRPQGTFHPKILIGSLGQQNGIPIDARAIIVGSGNLSKGGLLSNVECGLTLRKQTEFAAAPKIFSRLWGFGTDLTANMLADYAVRFRDRNANRSSIDLVALGVSDESKLVNVGVMRQSPAAQPSMKSSVAKAAWAGLQSFTGDYTFQLEFPRDAGDVLRRIVTATGQTPKVTVKCDDGIDRPMKYAYYPHNGMFRLNIPNDVPGIPAARINRNGIALIEGTGDANSPMHIRVSADQNFVRETAGKSFLLGTWGKTPTRLYGWY